MPLSRLARSASGTLSSPPKKPLAEFVDRRTSSLEGMGLEVDSAELYRAAKDIGDLWIPMRLPHQIRDVVLAKRRMLKQADARRDEARYFADIPRLVYSLKRLPLAGDRTRAFIDAAQSIEKRLSHDHHKVVLDQLQLVLDGAPDASARAFIVERLRVHADNSDLVLMQRLHAVRILVEHAHRYPTGAESDRNSHPLVEQAQAIIVAESFDDIPFFDAAQSISDLFRSFALHPPPMVSVEEMHQLLREQAALHENTHFLSSIIDGLARGVPPGESRIAAHEALRRMLPLLADPDRRAEAIASLAEGLPTGPARIAAHAELCTALPALANLESPHIVIEALVRYRPEGDAGANAHAVIRGRVRAQLAPQNLQAIADKYLMLKPLCSDIPEGNFFEEAHADLVNMIQDHDFSLTDIGMILCATLRPSPYSTEAFNLLREIQKRSETPTAVGKLSLVLDDTVAGSIAAGDIEAMVAAMNAGELSPALLRAEIFENRNGGRFLHTKNIRTRVVKTLLRSILPGLKKREDRRDIFDCLLRNLDSTDNPQIYHKQLCTYVAHVVNEDERLERVQMLINTISGNLPTSAAQLRERLESIGHLIPQAFESYSHRSKAYQRLVHFGQTSAFESGDIIAACLAREPDAWMRAQFTTLHAFGTKSQTLESLAMRRSIVSALSNPQIPSSSRSGVFRFLLANIPAPLQAWGIRELTDSLASARPEKTRVELLSALPAAHKSLLKEFPNSQLSDIPHDALRGVVKGFRDDALRASAFNILVDQLPSDQGLRDAALADMRNIARSIESEKDRLKALSGLLRAAPFEDAAGADAEHVAIMQSFSDDRHKKTAAALYRRFRPTALGKPDLDQLLQLDNTETDDATRSQLIGMIARDAAGAGSATGDLHRTLTDAACAITTKIERIAAFRALVENMPSGQGRVDSYRYSSKAMLRVLSTGAMRRTSDGALRTVASDAESDMVLSLVGDLLSPQRYRGAITPGTQMQALPVVLALPETTRRSQLLDTMLRSILEGPMSHEYAQELFRLPTLAPHAGELASRALALVRDASSGSARERALQAVGSLPIPNSLKAHFYQELFHIAATMDGTRFSDRIQRAGALAFLIPKMCSTSKLRESVFEGFDALLTAAHPSGERSGHYGSVVGPYMEKALSGVPDEVAALAHLRWREAVKQFDVESEREAAFETLCSYLPQDPVARDVALGDLRGMTRAFETPVHRLDAIRTLAPVSPSPATHDTAYAELSANAMSLSDRNLQAEALAVIRLFAPAESSRLDITQRIRLVANEPDRLIQDKMIRFLVGHVAQEKTPGTFEQRHLHRLKRLREMLQSFPQEGPDAPLLRTVIKAASSRGMDFETAKMLIGSVPRSVDPTIVRSAIFQALRSNRIDEAARVGVIHQFSDELRTGDLFSEADKPEVYRELLQQAAELRSEMRRGYMMQFLAENMQKIPALHEAAPELFQRIFAIVPSFRDEQERQSIIQRLGKLNFPNSTIATAYGQLA